MAVSKLAKSVSQAALQTPLVIFVGNPNAGKTTLFNKLTGLSQRVGNYPGVTVEKVSGRISLEHVEVECLDVPGLYSLKAVSADEAVAADVIQGAGGSARRPSVVVCVMDATNLERNLFLFSQLADAEYPILVALTMTDLLAKSGATIDEEALSARLGVDVVSVVSHKNLGISRLTKAIENNIAKPKQASRVFRFPEELESQVQALHDRFGRYGIDIQPAEIRQAMIYPSSSFAQKIEPFEELFTEFEAVRNDLVQRGLTDPKLDLKRRYDWAARVRKEVMPDDAVVRAKRTTDRIDSILTNKVYGLILFIALMYAMFQAIYTLAQPLMAGIEWVFQRMGDWVGSHIAHPVLRSALVDGVLNGVGTVLTFLPQIMLLFLFIAVLEGTGYLARAAFMMDRTLGWCGLNGRAFVPLLSSFACAIPGVMATRVIPDPRSRLATILVAPLMSCSARLPVYILLIGAFIEPTYGPAWAGFALFGMHSVGAMVAIPVVWFLNRRILKGRRMPFVLELPPYQWPKLRDVWLTMYYRGKVFVRTAGTIIVVMSVVIWALLYFPTGDSLAQQYRQEFDSGKMPEATFEAFRSRRQLEDSYLGRFGRAIEPVFRPAGFDWRLSTGILAAFPAREVVVPSLGIIFSLGSDVDETSTGLRSTLQKATWPNGRPLLTPWTAAGYMVFFALCCQCMSTLAVVKKETNSWKWPVIMFTYMTVLAYLFALAINQVGLLFS